MIHAQYRDVVEHHWNSQRFRCACGRLHKWRWWLPVVQVGADKRKEVVCECGRYHYKPQRNFRGEGGQRA